ncbi:hypothetical protein C8R47DRAFT_1228974 [Mycena vitilis]|nr:hypothetical protein C8R47DRAFT_1228974 [Mycena vitilis]
MYGVSVHREVGLQRRDGNFEIDVVRQVKPIRLPAPAERAPTPAIHAPRPVCAGVPSFLRDAHVHRPAIGRPTALIAGDRGSQTTPPDPFQYVSVPPGAPPRFLTPNAIPTNLRDDKTGEVFAFSTHHHPTLPAAPRPDTPGLPSILHEGRPAYLIAPTLANSQRHLEELCRQLARTMRPTDASPIEVAREDVASQGSSADAEGITDDEDVEMTSPSRSNSNNGAVDEDTSDEEAEDAEENPEIQEVDSTQKVRNWLMDDSMSDKEAMRELDSSSEESDGILDDAAGMGTAPLVFKRSTGRNGSDVRSISADIGPLSTLTPLPPRLRLPIVNSNGTTSFRDDMGIPVSDDGSRLCELSHRVTRTHVPSVAVWVWTLPFSHL